jgi:chemotaxis protein CheX
MTHALLTDLIQRSAAAVFSTMLGAELPPGQAGTDNGTRSTNDGVVSLIGLAGAWAGTGSITCSPAVACRLCSLMLMSDFPAVNEDVLDAVAELTNMIIGGVKSELESRVGPLGLSIPTVVFGRNFTTRSAGKMEWTAVRFPWEREWLTVRMFLAPAEKAAHPHPAPAGHHCALEV